MECRILKFSNGRQTLWMMNALRMDVNTLDEYNKVDVKPSQMETILIQQTKMERMSPSCHFLVVLGARKLFL